MRHPVGTLVLNPDAYDVLCGRGKYTTMTNHGSHPGNIRFHDIINLHRPQYTSGRRCDKARIAEQVLSKVKFEGPTPGRFLKKANGTEFGVTGVVWMEITDGMAIEKICHALRGKERNQREAEESVAGTAGLNSSHSATSQTASSGQEEEEEQEQQRQQRRHHDPYDSSSSGSGSSSSASDMPSSSSSSKPPTTMNSTNAATATTRPTPPHILPHSIMMQHHYPLHPNTGMFPTGAAAAAAAGGPHGPFLPPHALLLQPAPPPSPLLSPPAENTTNGPAAAAASLSSKTSSSKKKRRNRKKAAVKNPVSTRRTININDFATRPPSPVRIVPQTWTSPAAAQPLVLPPPPTPTPTLPLVPQLAPPATTTTTTTQQQPLVLPSPATTVTHPVVPPPCLPPAAAAAATYVAAAATSMNPVVSPRTMEKGTLHGAAASASTIPSIIVQYVPRVTSVGIFYHPTIVSAPSVITTVGGASSPTGATAGAAATSDGTDEASATAAAATIAASFVTPKTSYTTGDVVPPPRPKFCILPDLPYHPSIGREQQEQAQQGIGSLISSLQEAGIVAVVDGGDGGGDKNDSIFDDAEEDDDDDDEGDEEYGMYLPDPMVSMPHQ